MSIYTQHNQVNHNKLLKWNSSGKGVSFHLNLKKKEKICFYVTCCLDAFHDCDQFIYLRWLKIVKRHTHTHNKKKIKIKNKKQISDRSLNLLLGYPLSWICFWSVVWLDFISLSIQALRSMNRCPYTTWCNHIRTVFFFFWINF